MIVCVSVTFVFGHTRTCMIYIFFVFFICNELDFYIFYVLFKSVGPIPSRAQILWINGPRPHERHLCE